VWCSFPFPRGAAETSRTSAGSDELWARRSHLINVTVCVALLVKLRYEARASTSFADNVLAICGIGSAAV
jgi:hypothetical protein